MAFAVLRSEGFRETGMWNETGIELPSSPRLSQDESSSGLKPSAFSKSRRLWSGL